MEFSKKLLSAFLGAATVFSSFFVVSAKPMENFDLRTRETLNTKFCVSNIFDEEPSQWGLRGDPSLWASLQQALASFTAKPYITPEKFENVLKENIARLCHCESGNLSEDIYVEEFDIGGMSGGYVDASWWNIVGIPMLVSRYKQLWDEACAENIG